jgi:hypothetical protein
LKDQTLVEIRHKKAAWLSNTSRTLHGHLCEGGQPTVGGQLTAQCVEDRGTPFLMTGKLSLLLGTDGQSADRKRNDQHDRKRQEILNVRHGEGQIRRNKEKSNAATLSTDARTDGPRPYRVATSTTPIKYIMMRLARPKYGNMSHATPVDRPTPATPNQ